MSSYNEDLQIQVPIMVKKTPTTIKDIQIYQKYQRLTCTVKEAQGKADSTPEAERSLERCKFVTVLHEYSPMKCEIQSAYPHFLSRVQSSNTCLTVTEKNRSRQNYIVVRTQGYWIKLSHIYNGTCWSCTNTEILWSGGCGCITLVLQKNVKDWQIDCTTNDRSMRDIPNSHKEGLKDCSCRSHKNIL